MTTTLDRTAPANHPAAFSIAIAWGVALLTSSLGDILWFELAGSVPYWLALAKVGLLGTLILLTWFWQPIKALRPFFIMLLALTSLMGTNA